MMKKLALPVVLFTLAGCSSTDQDPQGGHDGTGNVRYLFFHRDNLSKTMSLQP